LARKTNHNLKMTPLMSLAVFALFAMMIPLLTIANNNSQVTRSSAATPSPTPEAMEMDGLMEK
jgi:hypothetical protein